MNFYRQTNQQQKIDELFDALSRRRGIASLSACPVELTAAMINLFLAESCGKCVPCRTGLQKLSDLFEKILAKKATEKDLEAVESLAKTIYDSADCAIGFEAAKMVTDGLTAFRDDYLSHIENGTCTEHFASVPCEAACPAHVDVPAYIALVKAGRFADAIRVIRNDNPFPGVCGLICEHPCEHHCRRSVVDDAVNIRGLKRYAVEKSGAVPAPKPLPKNGKTVAVIGGGPAGLTAAYYLALKGCTVTVFEKRPKLGGMLRYGIPAYRLPDADLDRDIDAILSTGIEVRYGVMVGTDVSFEEIRAQFDAVYISIGAHGAKKLGCEGEDARGVLSASAFLGAVAAGEQPDFTGKRVAIVGGGNVAMDATRTSMRLGAKSVTCVYRRRAVDMTALPEEVRGAEAEGCEVLELMSPVRIATEDGVCKGLVVKPQIPGPIRDGRPTPVNADLPEVTVPADIVIIAIGQAIESEVFAKSGIAVKRERFVAKADGRVMGEETVIPGVFTGGDCYTGPATVIKAIDAGKVVAENIEAYFGLHADVREKIELPDASAFGKLNWGRVNMRERSAEERKSDLCLMEQCMTDEEAKQECARCLRCDHYGYGALRNGRK